MKKNIVLHPFFISIYPILFLLSENIREIAPLQAMRPMLISLGTALLLMLVFGFAAKDYQQGGFSASIILGLFFTYGHVQNSLEPVFPVLARHAVLVMIWVLLLFAGMLLKYRIRQVNTLTSVLNVITFALLLMPMINIGIFFSQAKGVQYIRPTSPLDEVSPPREVTSSDAPDIYYIILDAYGRSDVIEEIFNYDNGAFIAYLESRGFYIAKQSHSNYPQTAQSLASSLNLSYLDELENSSMQSDDRDPLAELIRHSEVRNFLEEQGYQTVAFTTGYPPTTLADAGHFFAYSPNLVNTLEGLVLTTSMTSALGDKMMNLFIPFYCDTQRKGILHIFNSLQDVPTIPGPKFVFAHISSPHPPFVFGADGQAVKHGECNGFDGTDFRGSREDYLQGYPQQLAYISKITEETIETILNNSSTPPIILIQGDHGSGYFLDFDSSEKTCLRERMAILSAYYLPKEDQSSLYPSITPVNSFRIVFNALFETNLPLTKDKSYFSSWDNPYQTVDITDQIEGSCPVIEN